MQNKLVEKKFNIPDTPGMSSKAMKIHLGLYSGYVKRVNDIYEALEKGGDHMIDLRRRVGFEFSGVLLHEVFFSSLEGGPKSLPESTLRETIDRVYGSFDKFIATVKEVALQARGPGWTLVMWDKENNNLPIIWVADHEVGSLPLPVVAAVDMWEHAYLVDYLPSEKSQYVESYVNALNWEVCASRVQ